MPNIRTYSFPTTIHAGAGSRHKLAEALGAACVKRPLVVTDRGLADLWPVQEMMSLLKKAGVEATLFKGIWGNPVKSQVRSGVDAYREGQCDALVGLGGGAALDVTKAIAVLLHHPGDLFEYLDGDPKARPVDQPLPPIMAVPTTAGTGSEVGRAAVISDDETHVKHIIYSPRLLPQVVCADAELTMGLPPQVTAATGMDALTHLVEAYLAKGYSPMCDGIALEGIHLVAQSLERCVAFARDETIGTQPEHVAARDMMLDAAMMGAVAFQKGLGVTHSCAHALSAICDLHHGLANAVMLATTMKFNLAAVPDRFARMAVVAGLEDASGEAFIDWIEGLNARIQLPTKLSDTGVQQAHIEPLVENALADGCHQQNPRAVSRDDFQALFMGAL